jgi:hypothetical protein
MVVMVRPSAWVSATRACSRGATRYSVASERMMEGNDVIVGRDLGCVIIPVISSLVVVRCSDRVMDSSIEGGEDRRR